MQTKDTLAFAANENALSNTEIFLIIIGITILAVLMYRFKRKRPAESTTIAGHYNLSTPKKKETKESSLVSDTPKTVFTKTKIKTDTKKPIGLPVKESEPIIKKPVIVLPEPEEETKVKYIGYTPINIFEQTEPLYFPYVMMPKPNCVIKFPRKGRTGRKGFKEEAFKEYIEKYFRNNYQVFDDRLVLVSNNSKPYEPDFTLINEKEGINIFVDIEIDEPYEGTNDIENRKPTHYKHSDINRNYAFTNRGWIVIRFAEIQVHKQPEACCKFIAHILKSIDSQFVIPDFLITAEKIQPITQWTEEEARQWSLDKYREDYLGIERFGVTANNNSILDIEDTELGEAIEELVVDTFIPVDNTTEVNVTKLSKLFEASVTGKYASFVINGEKRLVKPTYVYDHEISGFCYVRNEVVTYPMEEIEDVEIKDNYFTLQYYNESNTLDRISEIIKDAIKQKKIIRIVYTKPGFVNLFTGEITEREESERTLSDIGLSINVVPIEHIESYRLDENYVSGYCHTKEELRTFKFNRIERIEILDL